MTQKKEVAVFGGGCFWCIEAVFDELRGVTSVVSGYAGGEVKNPTYEQVCGGGTGHAEVIRIYMASGQTAAAQRQFTELERILREDLGSEPSPETRALLDMPSRPSISLFYENY